MFKRPTIKRGFLTPKQFVTEIRPNGTRSSTWVARVPNPLIPNGTPGRVGEIVDLMRQGEDHIKRPVPQTWTPPMDYQFVAKHISDEQTRLNYISKCEAWLADNPPPVLFVAPPKPNIDTDLVLALYKKYEGKVPPFEERMKVCRAAGYSEEYIAKKTERQRKFTEMAAERQKAIDAVFGKWPTANKTAPKPKTKVIKAVKKRT